MIREYERTSTTVLNAYLTPPVHRYLGKMRAGLQERGHKGAIAVMHSSGGVSSIEEASVRGVSLLSSGPAGGLLGTRTLAARLGLDPVLATDVGGTSFDVGLVIDGEPSYAEMPIYAKYPVALPTIDVPSIGAGGGSIGWVEPETGILRVGPQSAGARPGPAVLRPRRQPSRRSPTPTSCSGGSTRTTSSAAACGSMPPARTMRSRRASPNRWA